MLAHMPSLAIRRYCAAGGQLAVLHGVAMVEPRMLDHELFDGVDPGVDREVAVAVGVDVDAPFVERSGDVEQLIGCHHPLAVVGAGVVAGPAHLGGEPLDRPVEHQLEPGGAHLVGVGSLPAQRARRRRRPSRCSRRAARGRGAGAGGPGTPAGRPPGGAPPARRAGSGPTTRGRTAS